MGAGVAPIRVFVVRAIPLLMAVLVLVVPATATAGAAGVVPVERVRSRVVVRAKPDRRSPDVGSLRRGQRAEYLGAIPGWRRVRLGDGTRGFVSAAWTRVLRGEEAPGGAERSDTERSSGTERSSVWSRLGSVLGSLARSEPRVDVLIRDPEPGRGVHRNTDPDLPVAGFARLRGAGVSHDVMVALDVSGSTAEFAGADVDADGRLEDTWKGDDSIYRAQLAAVESLLAVLEGMPHNRQGQRIRVGVVTYGGDQKFDRAAEDEGFEPTPAEILRLASRDAKLRVPLTHDYRKVRRQLAKLARLSPVGMTDIAAGVGRALVELEGLKEHGARSRPRPEAQRVILLLTDGKPSLPYDRATARRATSLAGAMAFDHDVLVNAFAIGPQAAARGRRDEVRRMARRSGGRYVELETPADVADAVGTTSFSIVEKVKISNRTTGLETRFIATGIDGSFYGEITLSEGENEIEVAAVLSGGREAREQFTIEYVKGLPSKQLAQQLKQLRLENQLLIDRIKADLVRQMARQRSRQRKSLEIAPVPADQP